MKYRVCLALTLLTLSASVYAVDGGAVIGGALGGGIGAAIGSNIGGQNGAIVGGAIGGATGAALGSDGNQQAIKTSTRPERHDNGLHLGQNKNKHKKNKKNGRKNNGHDD